MKSGSMPLSYLGPGIACDKSIGWHNLVQMAIGWHNLVQMAVRLTSLEISVLLSILQLQSFVAHLFLKST